MTVKELSKLYWLNREVELNRKQLAALEAEIEQDQGELARLRISIDGLKSPTMSEDYPNGIQHTGTHSPVEDTVEHIVLLEDALRRKHDALVNLKAQISARQTLIVLERDRLERFIGTIPDSPMRQIFTFRFVNGLPWEQVAAGMGPGYLAESVRVSCYRYLRKHKE